MNNSSKHWLILGLGASGESAARLLQQEGGRISILTARDSTLSHDDRPHAAPEGALLVYEPAQVPWRDLAGCVVSPGFPFNHPWLNEARTHGVPLIPEYELGWSRFKGKTVAVTGSNGKSTFVKWCAEVLQSVGVKAVPCGNYGVPVCDCAAAPQSADVLIAELSSFQLEASNAFAADTAVLLNVLPNHLDRHGTMQSYTRIKLEMFHHMKASAPALIPFKLKKEAAQLFPRKQWITFGPEAEADYQYLGGRVMVDGVPAADLSGTVYGNDLMGPTGAACLAWLDAMQIDRSAGWAVLRALKPLPHRQETVAVREGVRFVNDSKATNMAALVAGVQAFGPGVRLIAGGQSKEKDFKSIKEVLAHNTRCVYLIGRDAGQMEGDWSPEVPCKQCGTLACAVKAAREDAAAGETILLSPGCTSYDQFRNFEERGKAFVEAVAALNMEE